MRHAVTLAAAALILAGCAGPTPPVVEPIPVPAGVSDQNRFVPPPGGFTAAAAAARTSQMQAQAQAQPPGGGMSYAGFAPIDDDGGFVPMDAGPTAAQAGAASGPNIVEYALGTSHPVGTPRYRRANPLRWQTWERNCARFPTQNAAQEAFLAAGGPERDRNNLDPDGDGYACWWDPEPFRRALRAGG